MAECIQPKIAGIKAADEGLVVRVQSWPQMHSSLPPMALNAACCGRGLQLLFSLVDSMRDQEVNLMP